MHTSQTVFICSWPSFQQNFAAKDFTSFNHIKFKLQEIKSLWQEQRGCLDITSPHLNKKSGINSVFFLCFFFCLIPPSGFEIPLWLCLQWVWVPGEDLLALDRLSAGCTPLCCFLFQRHKIESSGFLTIDVLWWSMLSTVSGVRLGLEAGGHVPVRCCCCCCGLLRDGCVSNASCRSKM